jgi:hypothetical protein
MKCITRNLVNEEFTGVNLSGDNVSFNKRELNKQIDLWKYILKYKCNAQANESILIGIQSLSIDYLAVCFASAELSLKIVIVDYTRKDNFLDLEFYDAKTKVLAPIDIFLYDFPKEFIQKNSKDFSKFKFFTQCSGRTYSIVDDIDFKIEDINQYNTVKTIMPKPSDVVMRCTSSGTTGTPKIVEHTHEFMYSLALRNAKKFSGTCLHTRNLNHGSSLAVYLLPTLHKVKTHLFYDVDEALPFDEFIDTIKSYQNSLEYIIFPYPFMIEEFISASKRLNINWPNLNVQTLSYISDAARNAVKEEIFKTITSIFGSNETSGPLFELTIDISSIDKDSRMFTKPDNFYAFNFYDNGLIGVTLPIYNTEIITNDLFEQQGDFFIHKGRSDFVKINGELIDIKLVNEINAKYTDSYLVTDSIHNCLYLAFWKSKDQKILDSINQQLENKFKRVKITKTNTLNKFTFLTGIKLDNELIREYFRNHV